MKKILMLIAGALAVSVVAATAQEVLSANAVGYIKKTLPANGGLVAMSIPLNPMDAAETVFGDTSVAEEAPVNAIVSFWDPIGQSWIGGAKSGKGWGPAEAGYVLQPGEGFFLKGDPAAVSDVEVTITGEVPSDATLDRAIPGSGALGTLANPYPVDFTFGTSAFASNASIDSVVSFWNVDDQSWIGGAKSGKGWGPAEAGYVVQAGEGFFLREEGAPANWTMDKPYTWPE